MNFHSNIRIVLHIQWSRLFSKLHWSFFDGYWFGIRGNGYPGQFQCSGIRRYECFRSYIVDDECIKPTGGYDFD